MNERTRSALRIRFRTCVIAFTAVMAVVSIVYGQTLTNADIIKMAQAKLGDAVITSEIKHSKCDFDTSPNALIKLKQAGVSDRVLEAMTEATHATSSEGVPPTSPNSSAIPMPQNYGIYAAANGKLLGIDVPTSTMVPKTIQVRVWDGDILTMFGPHPVDVRSIPVLPSDVSFVEYGSGVEHAINGDKVWVSPYIQSGPSGPADAWGFAGAVARAATSIPLLKRPMKGQTEADIASPSESLRPGVYWISPIMSAPFLFAVGRPGQFVPSHCADAHLDVVPCSAAPSQASVGAPSAPSSVDNQPIVAPAPLSCNDYQGCMRDGMSEFQASNLSAAISNFQRAANEQPTNADPWAWLGRAYLRTGQTQDFSQAWDKALRLGGDIAIGVWHELGLHNSEKGTFKISSTEVSFANQNGVERLTASPSQVKEIKAYRMLGTIYFRLNVSGKNYNFDVVPFGVDCQVSALALCPAPGVAQEQLVDNYVAETIPKLASGAFAPPPAPARPSSVSPFSSPSSADATPSANSPVNAFPAPAAAATTISEGDLISHGFRFGEVTHPMCTITGPEGPCQVEAFVGGEMRQDQAAYTCSKLDRASYSGQCVDGALQGVCLVNADGSTKSSKEAVLSYFSKGRIAYPALISFFDERFPPNFSVQEITRSYGCVYFGEWDQSKTRLSCPKIIDAFGNDIFTESNALAMKNGTFDLARYAARFSDYVQQAQSSEPPGELAAAAATSTTGCAGATDLGYSIRSGGNLYKAKGIPSASGGVIPVFLDQTGTPAQGAALLHQLTLGAWTRENIVASAATRSEIAKQPLIITDIISTSRAIQRYNATQDLIARSMTEALEAAVTSGASLSKAVPNLLWGTVKSQLLNSPRTLLALSAQVGLQKSLTDYQQLQKALPPAESTPLDITTLETLNTGYEQAQALDLPNEALATALMPTNGVELSDQALQSMVSELLPGLPAANEVVTAAALLDFQKSLAQAASTNPALQKYNGNLNLVLNLAAANNRTINTWASQAMQTCSAPSGVQTSPSSNGAIFGKWYPVLASSPLVGPPAAGVDAYEFLPDGRVREIVYVNPLFKGGKDQADILCEDDGHYRIAGNTLTIRILKNEETFRIVALKQNRLALEEQVGTIIGGTIQYARAPNPGYSAFGPHGTIDIRFDWSVH